MPFCAMPAGNRFNRLGHRGDAGGVRLWDAVARERTGCWALGRANLDFDHVRLGRTRDLRRLEMQFQRLLQICQSLFFSLALASDIHREKLRYIPIAFAPDRRGEKLHHGPIVPRAGRPSCSSMRPDPAGDLGSLSILRQFEIVV